MKVLVRADASSEIGSGHVVRTRTLAHALKDRGADVTFVCRSQTGNLIESIREDSFDVCALPQPDKPLEGGDLYARWLGVTQEEDARQTHDAVGPERWNVIIVDHYGLDIEWETAMRGQADRLVVVDDLANRRHDCDLLIDQNYAIEPEARYRHLVPAACDLMLGTRYALLKPDYASLRAEIPKRSNVVERMLVFFGAAAGLELPEMTLKALMTPALQHLHVDLVLGAGPDIKVESFNAQRSGSIKVYHGLPHLADLMANADIAIGAGGATTWERMCMGLPSIVVAIADNQRPATEALAQDDLICYLGRQSEVTVEDIAMAVDTLSQDVARRRSMSVRGMENVDGLGVTRVADAMVR